MCMCVFMFENREIRLAIEANRHQEEQQNMRNIRNRRTKKKLRVEKYDISIFKP